MIGTSFPATFAIPLRCDRQFHRAGQYHDDDTGKPMRYAKGDVHRISDRVRLHRITNTKGCDSTKKREQTAKPKPLFTQPVFNIKHGTTYGGRYYLFHDSVQPIPLRQIFFAIPTSAVIHIQNTAPGHLMQLRWPHRQYCRYRWWLKAPSSGH